MHSTVIMQDMPIVRPYDIPPDISHSIPLHHDRLTNKLQTPDRVPVGSAALVVAHLSKERQAKFPRNRIIKQLKKYQTYWWTQHYTLSNMDGNGPDGIQASMAGITNRITFQRTILRPKLREFCQQWDCCGELGNHCGGFGQHTEHSWSPRNLAWYRPVRHRGGVGAWVDLIWNLAWYRPVRHRGGSMGRSNMELGLI